MKSKLWVGSVYCIFSLIATHLTFPLPEENLEFFLTQEQQTAQGQTKRQNCSYAKCSSMLFYGNFGLICSWLSSFSPTRAALPFVL
jgi:hypothetical protein